MILPERYAEVRYGYFVEWEWRQVIKPMLDPWIGDLFKPNEVFLKLLELGAE